MAKNKLLYVVIISLFVHAGVFLLVYPVLGPGAEQTFVYCWGEVDQASGQDFREKTYNGSESAAVDSALFFLPSQRPAEIELEKFDKNSSTLSSVSEKPAVSVSKPEKEQYFLDLALANQQLQGRSGIDLTYSHTGREDLSKQKMDLSALISPSGRVVYVRHIPFSADIFLRFTIEDWLKKMVFPVKQTYYWKNIEIVLQ